MITPPCLNFDPSSRGVFFLERRGSAKFLVFSILTQYLPDRLFAIRIRKEDRLGNQAVAIDGGTCRATCQHQYEPAQQRVSPV